MRLRWPLLAVLSLTGGFLLALQLVYLHDATPAPPGRDAPGPVGIEPLQPAAPPPSPGEPEPATLAEAGPEAGSAPEVETTPDRGHELAVTECVERRALEAGVDRIRPTLPGRWPALKRAREVQRLRRLELRSTCERELARAN